MARVSIVMPVYNGEDFLREAIDSILNQTYSDWEFLIINEFGSNEEATAILYDYADKEPRIKLIQNNHRLGIAASLNVGLKSATGEYIARMDADDISMPERLENQVAYMDAHPEIAMCGTRVEVFGDKKFDWSVETNPDQIATDILFYSPCIHPTIMMRTAFMRDNNLEYNEQYRATEDYDLFSRICEKGQVANVDKVLFRYRLMEGNATFRNNDIGIKIYSEILMRQFRKMELEFTEDEISLLSPHLSLKNLCGRAVLTKFEELDWLLKRIYLANSKNKKYNTECLSHTLHKRYEDAYKALEWDCKSYSREKVDQIYGHSIFRHNYFGEKYPKRDEITDPVVTVLMPTYNSEKYVADTIDSVLRQSYSNFEFLIINEFGSDDCTVDFIRSFSDRRIKLIQNNKRLGLAESLNEGIRIARGKYIARIDADDLCQPDRFAKQVDFLEKNPEYGVCGSWQHHWGIETEWIHKAPVHHEQIKASLIYRCELCHSTLMMRRSFFVDNNLYYDSQYAAEDYELWTRAVFAFKFHNIPEVLGEYRVGEENITAKKMAALSKEAGELTARNLKQHLEINVPEEHQKFLSSWIHEFNHTANISIKRKHLRIEQQILKKMWTQNEILHVYDEDCLLSVINQRWKWITNDWIFGAEQSPVESIEHLFKHRYSLMKRVQNKMRNYSLKYLLKKLMMPLYRPFKHRICDRFDQLRQQLWDLDGHIYDHYEEILIKIRSLEQDIHVQNCQLEKVISMLNSQNNKIDNFTAAFDARIWKAEQNINQTTDSRVWKAEQNIKQIIDSRIWKSEVLLSEKLQSAPDQLREEIHRHIDFTYRDIMVALERQKPFLPQSDIRLITDYPIAYESLDHLYPHGTVRDNTRYPRFVEKCEELLKGKKQLSFLDLGCSGGGMVLEAALRGHISMGLEGSDSSKKEQRAEWRLLGDRLQTCDITKPFKLIEADGGIHQFDIITAWEVLEHIAEVDIPQLLKNIQYHLETGGYFIASIANWDDIDPVSGINWHVTCHPYDWWKRQFEVSGFAVCTDVISPIDLARGGYNPPHCYEMPYPEIDISRTFYIVAQKQ